MSRVRIRRAPRRGNIERVPPRIPVSETNLTAKERAMLPDPDWLTEDDADAIASMRAVKKAAGRSYSLKEVLEEFGLVMERSNPARRQARAARTGRRR